MVGVRKVLVFDVYDGAVFAELLLDRGRIAVSGFDERSFSNGGSIVLHSIDDVRIECRERRGGGAILFSIFDVAGGHPEMPGVPPIRNFDDLVKNAPRLKRYIETNLSEGESNARSVAIHGSNFWCYLIR